MIFGGNLSIKHEEGYALIDEWIRIRVDASTAVVIKKLRQSLAWSLKQKIARPELDVAANSQCIVSLLVKMLDNEEKCLKWGL